MASSLVNTLRRCPAEERRAVALELARTGSSEAVSELIRMVEGRRRWWLSCYDAEDQLIGVEALGATGSAQALSYLERVYSTVVKADRSETVVTGGGSEPRDDDVYHIEYTVHTYPLARGTLAFLLAYETVISVDEEYYGELSPADWPSGVDRQPAEDRVAHQTFRQAIARLREPQQPAG